MSASFFMQIQTLLHPVTRDFAHALMSNSGNLWTPCLSANFFSKLLVRYAISLLKSVPLNRIVEN